MYSFSFLPFKYGGAERDEGGVMYDGMTVKIGALYSRDVDALCIVLI